MKVTAKIQSKVYEDQSDGSLALPPPVDMVWSRDTDDLGVMMCVTQLLNHAKSSGPHDPTYLAITINL